ncbi:MAG TPA: hypothetical protein VMR45_03065 [Patescibacteria group bacterium]|nr:hypothetical protein [Patescibacteria group bacterium]
MFQGCQTVILRLDGGRWYIDVRGPSDSSQQSYDLTMSLPRRLSAGKIVVVHKNPKVFSSVIRKRWMRLLYEVEIQRSSTLNPLRRDGLKNEINQMKNCRFSARPPADAPKNTKVLIIKPDQVEENMPAYNTLCIATPLVSQQVLAAMRQLQTGGLIIIFGEWTIEYEIILQRAFS